MILQQQAFLIKKKPFFKQALDSELSYHIPAIIAGKSV